eukprot:5963130-Prymnesium_polylepis.1
MKVLQDVVRAALVPRQFDVRQLAPCHLALLKLQLRDHVAVVAHDASKALSTQPVFSLSVAPANLEMLTARSTPPLAVWSHHALGCNQ